MIAVVHVLAGATVGVLFNDPTLVFTVSLFLHYLMDLLPHIDPETFAQRHLPYSWSQYASIIIDGCLSVSITLLLFMLHARWNLVFIGCVASLLPDMLIPLEKYSFFRPLRRFHDLFHWDRQYARQWSWYVAGLATPTIIAALSGAILWSSLY